MWFSLAIALFIFLNAAWTVAGQDQVTTVSIDDPRLVTVPPDIWSNGANYHPDCGGIHYIYGVGEAVSLSFVGTGVAVTFLYAVDGWIAEIFIDGTYIIEVNTNEAGVAVTQCLPLRWTSDVLVPANHTITVASIAPNTALEDTWVNINNFIYTAAASPSTTLPSSTTAPTPILSTSTVIPTSPRKNIGAIVGVIVGATFLLLLLTGALVLCRRRRQRRRASDLDVNVDPVEVFSGLDPRGNVHASPPPPPAFQGGASYPVGQRHIPSVHPSSSGAAAAASWGVLSPPPQGGATMHSGLGPLHTVPLTSPLRPAPPPPPLVPPRRATSQGQQLSGDQLDVVSRLASWDVPAPALAAVISSLRQGGGGGSGSGHESSPNAGGSSGSQPAAAAAPPPSYDFKEG